MPKNLSQGNYAQMPPVYGINDILTEIRQKSLTEKEKGTDFERLMKLWFLTGPRYANLQQVWLWEEFPARKDFGGKDLGFSLVANAKKLLDNINQSVKLGFLLKYSSKFYCNFKHHCFGEALFDHLVMIEASFRTDFEHRTYHKRHSE